MGYIDSLESKLGQVTSWAMCWRREGARTKTCTLLTDVAAKELAFHWGDASAWRAPTSGLPVRNPPSRGAPRRKRRMQPQNCLKPIRLYTCIHGTSGLAP